MENLKCNNISKSFPGVHALRDVDLTILPGEIHSICGENGAGKSTLMNILAGNLQPDSGEVLIDGRAVKIESPQMAFTFNIAIVYQHLSLVDSLSVAENIFANRQPANRFGFIEHHKLHEDTRQLLDSLGLIAIRPDTMVFRLSPAEKQMIEIAKALSRKPAVLILDEPTASLSHKETQLLFTILRTLKESKVAILYISHRLDEIFALSDRISILKDGRSQGTFMLEELSREKLIATMVGRPLNVLKDFSHSRPDVLLEVSELNGAKFKNISFKLHQGEIVGLAGLIGAGRAEIARALIGVDERKSGTIMLNGVSVYFDHPRDSIERGISYVPEERERLGLFPEMSVRDNIVSGDLGIAEERGFYSVPKATRVAEKSKNILRIATPTVDQKVMNLSGGNQQKVVLAKWLLTNPKILIVDEPTHGIDIGAKFEIYEILRSLAAEGKSILIISSDLPELLGLCDRIIVIREGEVAGDLPRAVATEEKVMSLAAH
ncbi:MAG: sugar ABC transporter ATP-binding protein [Chryseolinea sp.]